MTSFCIDFLLIKNRQPFIAYCLLPRIITKELKPQVYQKKLKQRKSAAGLEHRYKVNEQLHTIFNRTISLLPRHKPLLPRFRDRFLELPVTCRAR